MSILYYYFNAVIKIKYIAKSPELTFPWDLENFARNRVVLGLQKYANIVELGQGSEAYQGP